MFFELFSRHAGLCVEGAHLLRELLDNLGGPATTDRVARIHAAEHAADTICQETMEALHRSFVTPIERSDIHRISSQLDDILDHIEAVAQRVELYGVVAPTPEIGLMAVHLVDIVGALKRTVDTLGKPTNGPEIRALCNEVKRVEKENDRLLRRATARLFREEQDPKMLIKWKEIYENLENAIDRCEDVANVIEGVVLENA
jgi:predicted phosphate transport protein (TIGR00153 family)